MSDPNLPDPSGFIPFQPVYSNPRNGQLITLCQILEALKSGGSSPASNVSILANGSIVSTANPLPTTFSGGVSLNAGSNLVGAVNVDFGGTAVSTSNPLPVQFTASSGSLPAGTNSIGSVNPNSALASQAITTASGSITINVGSYSSVSFSTASTASAGTISLQASIDGTNFFNTSYVPLTSGNSAYTFNAATATAGQISVTAFSAIRFVASGNNGTVTFTYIQSFGVSNVQLDNPLPSGTNVIGVVSTQGASGSITMTNSSVGTSSATLLAASSASKMLTIQNTSASNTLYVSTTSPATATNGIAIGAGIGYQFPYIPTNALYCLGSAASTTYTIWYA